MSRSRCVDSRQRRPRVRTDGTMRPSCLRRALDLTDTNRLGIILHKLRQRIPVKKQLEHGEIRALAKSAGNRARFGSANKFLLRLGVKVAGNVFLGAWSSRGARG